MQWRWTVPLRLSSFSRPLQGQTSDAKPIDKNARLLDYLSAIVSPTADCSAR